jgi:hypothetical protein
VVELGQHLLRGEGAALVVPEDLVGRLPEMGDGPQRGSPHDEERRREGSLGKEQSAPEGHVWLSPSNRVVIDASSS